MYREVNKTIYCLVKKVCDDYFDGQTFSNMLLMLVIRINIMTLGSRDCVRFLYIK